LLSIAFAGLIEKLLVYPQNMQKNLDRLGGLVHSQRLLIAADAKRRQPRGRLQVRAAQRDCRYGAAKAILLDLLKKDADVKKYLTDAEIAEQFDLGYHFTHVGHHLQARVRRFILRSSGLRPRLEGWPYALMVRDGAVRSASSP